MRTFHGSSVRMRGTRLAIVATLVGLTALGPIGAASAAETNTPSWTTYAPATPELINDNVIETGNPLYTWSGTTVTIPATSTTPERTIWQRLAAPFLWLWDSAISVVSQNEANTDIVAPAPVGSWGLVNNGFNNGNGGTEYTYGFSIIDDDTVRVGFRAGSTDDHDCWGILPVYYNAPVIPDHGFFCGANGAFPSQNSLIVAGTYAKEVNLTLSESSVTPYQWRGFRIYSCKSDGNPQRTCLEGQYTFRIQHTRNITVGDFTADPDRRLASIGKCRDANGGEAWSSIAYSPTYTQATGTGKIVRPSCVSGRQLVYVKTDLQTKNTSGNWVTTIVNLYTAEYTASIKEDPEAGACLKGDGCTSTGNVSTNTCTVGTVVSRCVALPGQIISTTSVQPSPTPTPTNPPVYVPGETQCNVSFNLADTAGCVIRWAFVPQTLSQRVEQVKTSVRGSAFGTVQDLVPVFTAPFTVLANAASGTVDCRGPKITFPFIPGSGDMYPFYACEGHPGYEVSGWVRNITKIVVIFGGLYTISGVLLAAFGARSSLPRVRG